MSLPFGSWVGLELYHLGLLKQRLFPGILHHSRQPNSRYPRAVTIWQYPCITYQFQYLGDSELVLRVTHTRK